MYNLSLMLILKDMCMFIDQEENSDIGYLYV